MRLVSAAREAAFSYLSRTWRARFVISQLVLLYVLAVGLTGCASMRRSDPAPTPTDQSSWIVGCLLAPLSQQARFAGTLLPETVLWIGETPLEDGHRLMILRAPDWDPESWLPYEREAVTFGARCKIGGVSSIYGDASKAGPPGLKD